MRNKFTLTKSLSLLILLCVLAGCNTAKLAYKISPEIRSVEQLKTSTPLVSINVIDKRAEPAALQEKQSYIPAESNEVRSLKKAILDRLTQASFKITTDNLLADISLTFEIEQLNTKMTSSLFKADLESIVHLRLIANRKGEKLEKLFKTARTQEIALPVNNNDVSGILNQALSAQLSNIFEDPQLLELAKKTPAKATDTFVIDPAR